MSTWLQRLFGKRTPHPIPTTGAIVAPVVAPTESVDDATRTSAEAVDHAFAALALGIDAFAPREPNRFEHAVLRRLDELALGGGDDRALPRLPAVVPQLLKSLRSDDASGSELAAQIARDPVLVGEVIRLANSAYYRTARPIASLRQAVAMLGNEGLRRLVANVAMRPIFRLDAGRFGRTAGPLLWAQAERCAHICAWLARERADAFEAYLAGIALATGAIASVRVLDQLDDGEPADAVTFRDELARKSRRISSVAARRWEFPPSVVAALDEQNSASSASISRLGALLAAADAVSKFHLLRERGRLPEDAAPPRIPAAELASSRYDDACAELSKAFDTSARAPS